MLWYVSKSDTILGKKCLKHRITKECSIFGKYGEIFENGPMTLGILIRSSKILNQYTKGGYKQGEEGLITVSNDELEKWCQILKVPKTLPAQIRYAELSE